MTRGRARMAVGIYGLLAAVAVLWAVLRGNVDLYHHPRPWWALTFPQSTGLSLLIGFAVGLAAVAITRVLVRRTRWAQRLHGEFRKLFGPLDAREIAVFAITSGIAEEMFFRGAVQPSFGLLLTSIIFGAVHVGPGREFLPWTLWAAVMGLIFGALYAATGALIGPIVAHVVINYENLHFINSYDPSPPAAGRKTTPSHGVPSDPELVSTRLRSGGRT